MGELLVKNDKDVLDQVETRHPELLLKVENFRRTKMTPGEQVAHSVDSILESIRTNPIVRAHFRKDPGRQSVHEKTQIECIKTYIFPDVVKLPAGQGGTYLCKNKLCKANGKRPTDATKTLDIYSAAAHTYGVLKHTEEVGGAQDNQCNDVKDFVRQCVGYLTENPDTPDTFKFYLDGAYYINKRAELNSMIPEHLRSRICITSVSSAV